MGGWTGAYPGEVVAEELVDVLVVEGLPLVEQDGVHVVDEEAAGAQHRDALLVHLLRLVDLVPQLREVRQVQRDALVGHHRAQTHHLHRGHSPPVWGSLATCTGGHSSPVQGSRTTCMEITHHLHGGHSTYTEVTRHLHGCHSCWELRLVTFT